MSELKVGRLEGAAELTLFEDEAALGAAADDFGHIVRRRPAAVVRPRSADEVAAAIRFARRHQLRVAPRGQGHSAFGQAQVSGGLVLELGALRSITALEGDRVRVGAGALWRDLLRATVELGLRPPVLTDYLGLSVGGTLSVGGIGSESFRCGAQVDNVLELEVVTGAGDLVTCSLEREPALFEAALAGLGQCGIIVSATIPLVPASKTIWVFQRIYPELSGMTRDLRRLAAEARFSGLTGFAAPAPQGGWVYVLEAIGAAEDDAAMLADLSFVRGAERTAEHPFFDYADRIAAAEAEVRKVGLWDHPHPWLDLFVPASRADGFIRGIMATLTPEAVGPLPVMLYPLRRSRLTRPLLRVPDEEMSLLFDVLQTAPRDPATVAALVARNRSLFEQNRDHGGTPYTIGAIPLSAEDWRRHFGAAFAGLAAAKSRFDPDSILGPGPGISAPS